MAREKKMQYEVRDEAVVWTLPDGSDSATFAVDGLPEDVLRKLLTYGLQHILRDRTSAISAPADKLATARTIYEKLRAGEWKTRREGAGSRAPRVNKYVLQALMELKGWSEDEARDFIASLTPDQKRALPHHPKLAPIVARLRAEDKGDDLVVEL